MQVKLQKTLYAKLFHFLRSKRPPPPYAQLSELKTALADPAQTRNRDVRLLAKPADLMVSAFMNGNAQQCNLPLCFDEAHFSRRCPEAVDLNGLADRFLEPGVVATQPDEVFLFHGR